MSALLNEGTCRLVGKRGRATALQKDGEMRRRGKSHRLAGGRMREGNFRRVQENACRRGAAVKRVAENREAALRRVDADLVRAAGQRRGFHAVVAADVRRLQLISDF